MTVNLVGPEVVTDTWSAYNVRESGPHGEPMDDYRRGLCTAALHNDSDAKGWFRRVLQDDSSFDPAFAALLAAYSADGEYAQIADLSRTRAYSSALDAETVLRVADASVRSGNPNQAIEWLQAHLEKHPPTESLYLELGVAYEKSGDSRRAADFRSRAAKVHVN